MAYNYRPGTPVYPNTNSSIIPKCVVDTAQGDHNAVAGNVVKQLNGDHYGYLQDNVDASQTEERALVTRMQAYGYTTTGVGKSITKGDKLTLLRQGAGVNENHWFWETAAGGETIFGYALADAGADDTMVLAEGPLDPPFQTV